MALIEQQALSICDPAMKNRPHADCAAQGAINECAFNQRAERDART